MCVIMLMRDRLQIQKLMSKDMLTERSDDLVMLKIPSHGWTKMHTYSCILELAVISFKDIWE